VVFFKLPAISAAMAMRTSSFPPSSGVVCEVAVDADAADDIKDAASLFGGIHFSSGRPVSSMTMAHWAGVIWDGSLLKRRAAHFSRFCTDNSELLGAEFFVRVVLFSPLAGGFGEFGTAMSPLIVPDVG
jgi:hypothetical protein